MAEDHLTTVIEQLDKALPSIIEELEKSLGDEDGAKDTGQYLWKLKELSGEARRNHEAVLKERRVEAEVEKAKWDILRDQYLLQELRRLVPENFVLLDDVRRTLASRMEAALADGPFVIRSIDDVAELVEVALPMPVRKSYVRLLLDAYTKQHPTPEGALPPSTIDADGAIDVESPATSEEKDSKENE